MTVTVVLYEHACKNDNSYSVIAVTCNLHMILTCCVAIVTWRCKHNVSDTSTDILWFAYSFVLSLAMLLLSQNYFKLVGHNLGLMTVLIV